MGKKKDLTTVEKQKVTKLLCEKMSILKISKELHRDRRKKKKKMTVKNLSWRFKSKEKVFGICFLKMNVI